MSDAVIIAKIGGRQRRLSTPKQWRAAIANHDITRVTPITYEPGPGRQADMLAGACPDLVPLFVEILGSRDIPVLSSIDEAEVVAIATEEPNQTDGMDVADHPVISSQPDPVAEPEVEPVAVFTDDAEDRSADQDIAYEPPPSTASDMPVGRVIFAIFLTLLLIGAIAKCAGKSSSDSAISSSGQNATSSMAASDAAANQDDPATWQTMYGANPLNVRIAPSGSSRLIATLPRSTELTGVIVPGGNDATTNWFLIKRGPQTGRYVSAVNLSSNAPPDIDAQSAGDYYVISDAAPLTSPADDSATIDDAKQKFHAGQKVKTNGTIGTWAEVGLNQGGVGYLPTSNLSITKPAPLEGIGESEDLAQTTISITNRCQSQLKIGIYYHSDNQWHDNGNMTWIWGPGSTSHPSITSSDDQRIRADRNDIYVIVFERDGTSYYNGESGDSHITYGGRSVSATEYSADTNSEGSYQISIC